MSYTKHFPDGIYHVKMAEKKCSKCGMIKAIDQFAKKHCSLDGKTSECFDCIRVQATAIRERKKEWNLKFI